MTVVVNATSDIEITYMPTDLVYSSNATFLVHGFTPLC
jgi:hypothetical protein